MKYNRAELVDILTALKPGLAKRAIIEQFTHFIFTGEDVVTYNDEICISHPLKTDFTCSVKADDLLNALKRTTADDLLMKLKDNELFIQTTRMKLGLSTSVEKDAEEMLELMDLKGLDGWVKLPSDFIRGAFLCMFSASTDQSQGVLTSVYVKDQEMASTDELRMSLYEMDGVFPFEVLIPAVAIKHLVDFEVKEVTAKENWIHFKTDKGVLFNIRVKDGDYVEVDGLREFFNIEGPTVTLPDDLKNEIDSVSFMTEAETESDRRVDLTISGEGIRIKAQKEIGWIEKELDFKYDGEPVKAGFHPAFLSQVLEKVTTMTIGEDSALFVSDSFKHIVSLQESAE